MAKTVSPDKGKSVDWYRNEKLADDWQRAAFDQFHSLVMEIHPAAKSSIKWSQPVYETAEGPMAFVRGAAKHVTFGFWRGAEFEDPTAVLEGEGDRMKHVKIKNLEAFDRDLLAGFLQQAVALNAQKGDPTKGK